MYLYIHGYESSGESLKADILKRHFSVIAPSLDNRSPLKAIEHLESIVESNTVEIMIGSSLGGFYAAYLSGKYNIPCILINPVVSSEQLLPLTDDKVFISELKTIELKSDSFSGDTQVALFLSTDDDVIDYKRAEAKFPNALRFYSQNGGHEFRNFEGFIPRIRELTREFSSRLT